MSHAWAAAHATCDSSGPLQRGAIFKIRLPQKLVVTETMKHGSTKR